MAEAEVAIVTGGGRGIGRAVSLALARVGWDVMIGYHSDANSANAVVADIEALGRRARCCAVDVVDEESVGALFAAAEAMGPVTGVVNNAGEATAVGRLKDNALADIRRDLDIDLFGVVVCCKFAQAALTRFGNGSIVSISSAAATLGSPSRYVHYAAAKAGVDALTLGLPKELASTIRVNAVSPGTIWTDFHRESDRPARVAPTVPLGRAGTADDIAGAVVWLMSEDASYVTGEVLRVAGRL